MAKGLTPKQDAFARKYVECNNASEAYRTCYDVKAGIKPETVWRKACELMANGMVSARVFALQEMAQERTLVTVQSLTEEYEEARQVGISGDQSAAMSTATTGKAKLHGLMTEKNETTHSGKIGGNWTVEVVRPKATE